MNKIKKVTNDEFQNKILIISNFLYSRKWKKINIYFDYDKYPKEMLLHILYNNLPHLLGMQYYVKILKIGKNKKRNTQFLEAFFKNVKNKKILWSSIVKKIEQNWREINPNLDSPHSLIYILLNKIEGFLNIVKLFINNGLEQQKFNIYEFKNKLNSDYFIEISKNKKYYLFLGIKKISNSEYNFETFKPVTIVRLQKKELTNNVLTCTKIRIS